MISVEDRVNLRCLWASSGVHRPLYILVWFRGEGCTESSIWEQLTWERIPESLLTWVSRFTQGEFIE